MDDKDVPVQFHLLDGFETIGAHLLEPRQHLLCVYGDNWLKDVKYQLRFLPITSAAETPVATIRDSETKLLAKKNEMSKFQEEYVEAKKRYEDAVKRLQAETDSIMELRKIRDDAYDQMLGISAIPFSDNKPNNSAQQSKGFLSGLFG